jgi:hypothetical protein
VCLLQVVCRGGAAKKKAVMRGGEVAPGRRNTRARRQPDRLCVQCDVRATASGRAGHDNGPRIRPSRRSSPARVSRGRRPFSSHVPRFPHAAVRRKNRGALANADRSVTPRQLDVKGRTRLSDVGNHDVVSGTYTAGAGPFGLRRTFDRTRRVELRWRASTDSIGELIRAPVVGLELELDLDAAASLRSSFRGRRARAGRSAKSWRRQVCCE